MVYRRYKVISLVECQHPGCGGIIVGLIAIGGAPDDPYPEPDPAPPHDLKLEPEIPESLESLFDIFRAFGGSSSFNVERVGPGGAMITGNLGRKKGHRFNGPDWTLEFTPIEYASIGPLTIGDILTVEIGKLTKIEDKQM